jgi:hypothetical protein
MINCNLVEPYVKQVMNNRLIEHNNKLLYNHYLSFNTIMMIILFVFTGIFLYVTRSHKLSPADIKNKNIQKYKYIQDKAKYVQNRKETWNNHPELLTLSGIK